MVQNSRFNVLYEARITKHKIRNTKPASRATNHAVLSMSPQNKGGCYSSVSLPYQGAVSQLIEKAVAKGKTESLPCEGEVRRGQKSPPRTPPLPRQGGILRHAGQKKQASPVRGRLGGGRKSLPNPSGPCQGGICDRKGYKNVKKQNDTRHIHNSPL